MKKYTVLLILLGSLSCSNSAEKRILEESQKFGKFDKVVSWRPVADSQRTACDTEEKVFYYIALCANKKDSSFILLDKYFNAVQKSEKQISTF